MFEDSGKAICNGFWWCKEIRSFIYHVDDRLEGRTRGRLQTRIFLVCVEDAIREPRTIILPRNRSGVIRGVRVTCIARWVS